MWLQKLALPHAEDLQGSAFESWCLCTVNWHHAPSTWQMSILGGLPHCGARTIFLSRQSTDMGTGTGLLCHHCLLRAKPRACLEQILGMQGYMTANVTSHFDLGHALVTFLMVVSVSWWKTISGSRGLFRLIV